MTLVYFSTLKERADDPNIMYTQRILSQVQAVVIIFLVSVLILSHGTILSSKVLDFYTELMFSSHQRELTLSK